MVPSTAGYGFMMTLEEAVDSNPERRGGELCFRGTRVPVTHLRRSLEAGMSLEEFLEGYPTVGRDQAHAVLAAANRALL